MRSLVSPTRSSRVLSASVLAAVLASAVILTTTTPLAQGPPPSGLEFYTGKNVDIVGPFGTGPNPVPFQSPQFPNDPTKTYQLFIGDPDKKQQNEPSCDISPNNPLIIFCGMNDYRGVDRPEIIGEPWIGASFSEDGGLSFKSFLHPGFKPKDPSSPIPFNALGWETAADPVVRVVPGMALYNFIAFNRDGNGALLLSRWREKTIEGGFPYEVVNTGIEVAKGTGAPGDAGRFLDKPGMKISLNPAGGFYNFNTGIPTGPGQTLIQKVPAGTVHLAYAVFPGNSQQDGTKIIYTNSQNYGDSFSPQTSLAEAQSINQAADIAVDSATNRVLVTWRRFLNDKQKDAIMYALSNDGGKSFGRATEVAEICPFNQGTTSISFRTTSHPSVEFDGTTFHVVWADRLRTGGQCSTTGYSRIVMSSLQSNGRWSNPQLVDAASPAGHQFQPAIVAAGSRIMVTWLDTRNDVRSDPTNFPDPVPDPFIQDFLFVGSTPLKVRRRAGDIFVAQATTGFSPVFGPPTNASRYRFGVFPGRPAQVVERNKKNARMFQSGKVPFHGDYVAAAGVRWALKDPVTKPGEWVSSAGLAGAQPYFHIAWTDNRLVRGDVSGLLGEEGSGYTPPPLATFREDDPTTPRGVCEPAKVGTRDQTVMAAGVYPALLLGTASASKPTVFNDATGQPQSISRAYTVFVQNRTLSAKTEANGQALTLRIAALSQGATASFDRTSSLVELSPVEVAGRSTTARTVYVSSPVTIPSPVVKIELLSAGSLVATTYINGNPFAPPLEDALDPNDRIPDSQVGQIELHTPDIEYRSTSIGIPALDDPALDDPALDDPALDDPALDDPALDDPALDDPALDDPALDDPALDDPALDDPALDDPALDDAAIASSSLQDPDTSDGTNNSGQKLTQITWKITLDGNTTTAMSSKVFLNADPAALAALNAANRQLIVSRRYRTTDVHRAADNTCEAVRVSNFQVIANVLNPTITNEQSSPSIVNPGIQEPSFTVPPGSAVYLTLRVWGDVPGFNPSRIGMIVSSQPGDAISGSDTNVLPIVTVPENISDVEATSAAGAVVTFAASAVDLNGNPLPTTCTPASGSTFALGSTTVSCTANDGTNTGSATFAVTVVDSTPPVFGATPPDVTAEASGPSGAAVSFVPPTATDSVGGSIASVCAPASGSTFAVGQTSVQCTATDAAGNAASTSFNVNVTDTTGPVVNVPGNLVAEATSAAGAAVTFVVTASDLVDGSVAATCAPASGATFALGTTSVSCSATDSANNSGQASFTVTVRDTTPPLIVGTPGNITNNTAGTGGVVITYPLPTATDLVSGAVPVTCAPPSGSTFPVGVTTVTCSATDAASNTAQTTFTVTVALDGIKPSITASVSPTTLWPPDGAMVPVTVSGTANDAQSGMASIRWSVVDEYGLVQPTGSIAATNGPFSFTIMLQRDRNGNDKNGRHYTINVFAVDQAGNEAAAKPLIVNVHDQGK